jgi:tRNA pseudouridine55 synthase
MDGILLFDKPILWTSHDAVDYIRKKIGQRSVGHAGTLDPLATGLLVILIGKATKLSNTLISMDKDYSGSMSLGFSTDTQDLEGRISSFSESSPEEARVRAVFSDFTGQQSQTPPAYSAVRQNGKKLYELARQGGVTDIKPRDIYISALTITRIDLPEVCFFLTCSKGAYVRSLCDDIGKKLGCGATLSALVRNRIGPFRLTHALKRQEIDRSPSDLLEKLLLNFNPTTNEYLSRN